MKLTKNQTTTLIYINSTRITSDYGIWFDTLAADLADNGAAQDKKQAKVILNQLIKKSLLGVDTTIEEGSSFLTITPQGEVAIAELEPVEEEEDVMGDVEEALHPHQEVLAVAEIEDEDLLGQPAKERVVTHTENYTVNEWTDSEDTEWTETVFPDGSRTIKRRQKVSGSWRTDYWGSEYAGDDERYTTSKFAKMARAYGNFTRNYIAGEEA